VDLCSSHFLALSFEYFFLALFFKDLSSGVLGRNRVRRGGRHGGGGVGGGCEIIYLSITARSGRAERAEGTKRDRTRKTQGASDTDRGSVPGGWKTIACVRRSVGSVGIGGGGEAWDMGGMGGY